MLCGICCEHRLTPSSTVACKSCDFQCCKACVKRYLLDSNETAHCMSCRCKWTHHDLLRYLPRVFVEKDLKRHREDVLLDAQKSMLIESQNDVEIERDKRARIQRIEELTVEKRELQQRLRGITSSISNEYHQIYRRRSQPVAKFIMKCSRDECRGFLKAPTYRCSTCEGYTCSRCLVFKGFDANAPHECDEDAVATVQLLRSDSKPCPSCGTFVHKYTGCSHMWCVVCKTAFDYNTLRLLGAHSHFHNPHFAEYLATQRTENATPAPVGRNLFDIPCGGNPTPMQLSEALWNYDCDTDDRGRILRCHRVLLHVEQVVMPRYQQRDTDETRHLRVAFSLGDFGETEWKRKLQRIERTQTRGFEIYLVLEMVITASHDLFRQMMVAGTASRGPLQIMDEIDALLRHANKCLDDIHRTFQCVRPVFIFDPVYDVRTV